MPTPIEDYALLSDCRTAALVSREGSIDWLCAPRYDSPSVFGALLGDEENGNWTLRPTDLSATPTRRYDGDTFVLITRWECAEGVAEVHEFLAVDMPGTTLIRRIKGVSGRVEFIQKVRFRFDYSRAQPWVRQVGTHSQPALIATAGPEAIIMRGARLRPFDRAHHGTSVVEEDEVVDLSLMWFPSYQEAPDAVDPDAALEATWAQWSDWAATISHRGIHSERVVRSLLVLRALTHADTGGIVAAATTSLPESFGGARNWDYRYVWLRDASLTLEALTDHGILGPADHWRQWLLRAIAGDAADTQIMYGIAGERDLAEREMTSLPGYGGAAPVRVGNGAVGQYQADVAGEVFVALEAARMAGLEDDDQAWSLQTQLLSFVEANLDRPDNGIWEVRGEPQKFTHSRVMVWSAFDRGVRAVEGGQPGHLHRWRRLRDQLRAEIDEHGIDAEGGHFVQHYGSTAVDASLLLLPIVGFCAADDPRMLRTVEQIERQLLQGGLVHRYLTTSGVDGLAGDENAFLACSFWLVEQYAATGRLDEASALMDRVCALASDIGLLSEEYDIALGRQAGNTPQAFSHLALVRAADALAGCTGRGANRTDDGPALSTLSARAPRRA